MRIFLLPFSTIFSLIISIRDWLYTVQYLKSIEFDFPVICVGNLSVGGTGKTSHVEYLIRLLSEKFRVAVMSRGYKRQTSGYLSVMQNSSASELGDEPVMMKRKYPHAAVAVCEDREMGVPQLLSSFPQTDVVLLDDGFQHRSVRAGLNILLTEYSKPFTRDYLLPAGDLREFRSGYKRAEFIVVTKCPVDLSKDEKEKLKQEIAPQPGQLVFFSYQTYDAPYLITDSSVRLTFDKTQDVLLISGIASPNSMKQYLKEKVHNVYSIDFHDHHRYGRTDVETFTEAFGNIETQNKLLLTTEKDAVKLIEFGQWIIEKKLPIFVLPVKVEFFNEDKILFDSEITGWLEKLKSIKA